MILLKVWENQYDEVIGQMHREFVVKQRIALARLYIKIQNC